MDDEMVKKGPGRKRETAGDSDEGASYMVESEAVEIVPPDRPSIITFVSLAAAAGVLRECST